MAFTLLAHWLETHSLRSDPGLVRAQRRDARRLLRDVSQDLVVGETIKKAYISGKRAAIEKAWRVYGRVMIKEMKHIQAIIVLYKTALNRNLDKLETIEASVRAGPASEERERSMQEIKAMASRLSESIEGMLRQFTSFSNTNMSTLRILERSSQARDMYYAILQSRGDIKAFDRNVDAAKIGAAAKSLDNELSHQSRVVGDAMLLLQEMLSNIEEKRRIITRMEETEWYPRPWADEDRAVTDHLLKETDAWVRKEIAEGRIFISDARRA